MAYIKFGDCYTIRKIAKLKQSPNILVTWYIHVMVYSIANIFLFYFWSVQLIEYTEYNLRRHGRRESGSCSLI